MEGNLISPFVSGTRFEASRKLKAMLKRDEPAEELTKRVSVVPQKYRDDSSGSASDDETQILEVKVRFVCTAGHSQSRLFLFHDSDSILCRYSTI